MIWSGRYTFKRRTINLVWVSYHWKVSLQGTHTQRQKDIFHIIEGGVGMESEITMYYWVHLSTKKKIIIELRVYWDLFERHRAKWSALYDDQISLTYRFGLRLSHSSSSCVCVCVSLNIGCWFFCYVPTCLICLSTRANGSTVVFVCGLCHFFPPISFCMLLKDR